MMLKTFRLIAKHIEGCIDKNIGLKIFFHDSNFYVIKKIRNGRLKNKRSRYSRFPRAVQIEISTLCGAKCLACWTSGIKRPRTIIDEALYKKIVTECSDYKTGLILSRIGEPTLDPGLPDKIRFASGAGIEYISLTTNGALMDERLSREIIESGLSRIIFSLDGVTRRTYELMREGLDFDAVTNNIEGFIRMRNALGKTRPLVAVNFLKTKFNAHEWREFKKIWGTKADTVYCWPLVERHKDRPFSLEDEDSYYKRRMPCFMLWDTMSIYVNGLVEICCRFANEELVVGDTNKQSLKEVWNSDKLSEYRALHSQSRFNELPLCDKCDIWRFPVTGVWPDDQPWYY